MNRIRGHPPYERAISLEKLLLLTTAVQTVRRRSRATWGAARGSAGKGYGAALMGGIAAAHGRFVVMGDADDSYDFLELPRFVEKLRDG
jgi:hypothetical protein